MGTGSLTVPSLTYNGSNELISTSRSSYTYDYNGNLISKSGSNGATSYAWDYENRLASVTLPGSGGTVTFKYDPFGRRIQKSGPAGTTNFLYDGANIVADLDVSGTVLARYTQGSGIDEPLASVTGLGAAFFEADGLGSVTSLSGASGVTDTYTFKPFGITTANGSNPNRFRFTGREWDQETGLYYYRARYYDPAIGRFTSEDPLGFGGSGPNVYSYAFNNSPNLTDPSGMASCDCNTPPAGPTQVPWADIDSDIHEAMEVSANEPLSYSVPWFVQMVQKGGAWDYDSYYPSNSTTISDPYGNYHFGAVCNAMGYSLWQCQGGGGLAQYAGDISNGLHGNGWHLSGSGLWPLIPPYGDRKKDSELIRLGWQYADWRRRCHVQ